MDVETADEHREERVVWEAEGSPERLRVQVLGGTLDPVRDHLAGTRRAERADVRKLRVRQRNERRGALEHPPFEQDPVCGLAAAAPSEGHGVVPAVRREHVRATERPRDRRIRGVEGAVEMDHVDPALLGHRRRGPADPPRRSHRNLGDARGLQEAVLIRVGVRRPLVQLPDVHPVASSRQGCRQVNDDRQDARPRLLTPRRDLRDAHADTVATVLAMGSTRGSR